MRAPCEPDTVFGYGENEMRELTVAEVEQVEGGTLGIGIAVGSFAGMIFAIGYEIGSAIVGDC